MGMRDAIHQTAFAAWTDLCERGGLELDGRDEGLEEALKKRLAPRARNLELALRGASTDDLVRCLFEVLQPYVQMFRATLAFFERAGATEGREQWNIQIDEIDLDLDHFRKFLRKWQDIECEIEVPALDSSGAWTFERSSRDMPEMQGVSGIPDYRAYRSSAADVSEWLQAYWAGQYAPLPASLLPSRLGPGYADAAGHAVVALAILREGWDSRDALLADYRSRRIVLDAADAPTRGTERDRFLARHPSGTARPCAADTAGAEGGVRQTPSAGVRGLATQEIRGAPHAGRARVIPLTANLEKEIRTLRRLDCDRNRRGPGWA
jgi:hypothetical protein